MLDIQTAEHASVIMGTLLADPRTDARCTQCEAEGFRRITFFPETDPDVLTVPLPVRMETGRSQQLSRCCSSNGNSRTALD
ncbi:MAG: hypothetical protein LKM31_07445 [Sphingobium sp.]|jgi:aminopeptidase N|nr:hypothetical protein [Sphingobium sp.]